MMHNQTLAQIANSLKKKEYSAVELAQHFIRRIESHDVKLNSLITFDADLALQRAAEADRHLASGQTHPLCGVPYIHKDIFCTQGMRTSCASKMLDNFIAPYDATVTERLNRCGMVMLAKANMDEFAMGSSNETSFYGSTFNPWDLGRVPGGSSGGSAAAVSARLAPVATGTDTGGSIRQPAALCGVTGLKPTYGRVSRYGMVAFASSMDQAGPMTQTAEDAALVLEAMAGFDEKDSTSLDTPCPAFSLELGKSIQGLRIGVPKEFLGQGLDPAVADQLQQAIKVYESLGATIKEVSLENSPLAVPVYYVVACAESSSNLARYDGVRYGYRCQDAADLQDLYRRSRSEGFGQEVKRRILMGTYVLSAGYYDAYYLKAQKVRQLISQDFTKAFKEVDLILGPTTPTPAFKVGEKMEDPVTMYLNDIYTIPANLAGLPAISLPMGYVNQLPVGMQLVANHLQEALMLNAAHQYQQHTEWHLQMPEPFK